MEEEKDLLVKAKIKASNMMAERFTDGFIGYLLTSYVIYNWENIVLIFKSKNPIEMTLIYISVQPNFAWRFFWLPMITGMVAALVFPFLTSVYAKVVARARVTIKFSNERAEADIQQKLTNQALRTQAAREKHDKTEKTITDRKNRLAQLEEQIRSYQEQKDSFEEYLSRLYEVYKKVPNIVSESNFETFFNMAEESNLLKAYPFNSAIRQMFERIIKENNKSPQKTDDK